MSETIEYKGLQIIITRDEYLLDPRVEYDNMCVMAFFHRDYTLGDKDLGWCHDHYSSWSEFREAIAAEEGVIPETITPVYMMNHGLLSVSSTPFDCPWDSGKIGFMYTTEDLVKKHVGEDRLAMRPDRLIPMMEDELSMYDAYLSGSVYFYSVEGPNGEVIDSCGGFYGSDYKKSGLLDQAHNAVDAWLEPAKPGEEKEYSFAWSKAYAASGISSVKAKNKLDAYMKAQEILGDLEGSMQYLPDENRVDMLG